MNRRALGLIKLILGACLLFAGMPFAFLIIFAYSTSARLFLPLEFFVLVISIDIAVAGALIYSGISDVDL